MDEERDNAAVLLEELHVGSKEIEADEVKARGNAYLAEVREIID